MPHLSIPINGFNILLKRFLLLLPVVISFQHSFAVTRLWTGHAGDGLWASAGNWNNNSVPAASDDVLLDNSFVAGNYTVTLPGTAVVIKTLNLSPAANDTIQLILPSSNMIAPSLTVTGPGYGIVINSGGIFKNASGLSSGASLSIADSIRINNGGRYIHSSKSPSANSVIQFLSKATGTEKGIFEFDVPAAANYDVSVSNRIFGTLVLSAKASGTNRSYTGSGTRQLTINGNLEINPGATFNIDLSGTGGNVLIKGDYTQNGGVFNIAHGPNNTTVKIAGQLQQSADGIITETDSGLPAIELNGTTQQSVSLQGTIANSIVFRMNNPAGAVLQSPLSLSYKLDLVNGVLATSDTHLLTLSPNCVISVDSTAANSSFIDGPLRKEGLSDTPWFLFPVGKSSRLQWLGLGRASGNFIVEFIRDDPHYLSAALDSGIAAITNTGYWKVSADASPAPSAIADLSYTGPNTAGITDMSELRVAQLSGGKWKNRNNTGTTGSAGSSGSVSSEWINPFPSALTYYTLAAGVVQYALANKIDSSKKAPAFTKPVNFDVRVIQSVTGNMLSLRVSVVENTDLEIVATNMQGIPVKKIHLRVPAGNTVAALSLEGLASGVYQIIARDNRGKTVIRRFVKQ